MKKVFVSGCYDIIHAGHIQFFEEARALGDHLTVCFASNDVMKLCKGRRSSLPDSHKATIIGSLKCVDKVVISTHKHPVFDFIGHWEKEKPHILAITEDDKNVELKKKMCEKYGVRLVILPKTVPRAKEIESTTSILARIKNIQQVPLRVDFGGGWLDVPRFAKKNAFIVNCSISPTVSLENWPYYQNSGLGGSAAYALLQIKSGVQSDLDMGVGWQDPAVIEETGLCVWRSGKLPILEAKYNPDWLNGKMLILWTGSGHSSQHIVRFKRDFKLIEKAGLFAYKAVHAKDLQGLAQAITTSYKVQLGEKMKLLPKLPKAIAWKYLGGGHGGYALYLFRSKTDRDRVAKTWTEHEVKIIEPYIKPND